MRTKSACARALARRAPACAPRPSRLAATYAPPNAALRRCTGLTLAVATCGRHAQRARVRRGRAARARAGGASRRSTSTRRTSGARASGAWPRSRRIAKCCAPHASEGARATNDHAGPPKTRKTSRATSEVDKPITVAFRAVATTIEAAGRPPFRACLRSLWCSPRPLRRA